MASASMLTIRWPAVLSQDFWRSRCGSGMVAFRTSQRSTRHCIAYRYMNDAYLDPWRKFITIVVQPGLDAISVACAG